MNNVVKYVIQQQDICKIVLSIFKLLKKLKGTIKTEEYFDSPIFINLLCSSCLWTEFVAVSKL